MNYLDITKPKNISLLTLIIIAGLFLSLISGWLVSLEEEMLVSIRNTPLPKYYFPTYLCLGLIFPLCLRIRLRGELLAKRLLNSYLLLLFGQIITEILFLIIVGKGTGVIVGLIFSVTRLLQLQQFRLISIGKNWYLFAIQLLTLLWLANVINILINRIVPAFIT